MIILSLLASVVALLGALVLISRRRNRVVNMLTLALVVTVVRIGSATVLAPESYSWWWTACDAFSIGAMFTALWFAWRMKQPLSSATNLQTAQRNGVEESGDQFGELAVLLAEQSVELERLSDDLTTTKQSSSEFVTNLSHEIRQPLTSIVGFAEMLSEIATSTETREVALTIQRNGKQLMELLSDVLDLASLESGKLRGHQAPYGPKQLVEEVAELQRSIAEEKRIEIKIDYDGQLPELVVSDATRLRQTLTNLVNNAIRFSEHGTVTITPRIIDAQSPHAQLEVSVTDTGIGMSEELISRLFQPFSRGTGRAEQFSGAGLGLTICRRQIDLLGGTIEVTSRPNQGSRFTVRIPVGDLSNVKMIDPHKQQLPNKVKRNANATLNCRVLVVEDSRDNQRLISFVLKKAGAKVELADDGAQGVAAVTKAEIEGKPFDVVLMDMQMPVLDGFDATIHLRSVGFTRPIIALTALALEGDRQRCMEAGCDDYITKPINRESLLQTVSEFSNQTVELDSVKLYAAQGI